MNLHLFLELAVLAATFAMAVQAVRVEGRVGVARFGALLGLGFVRENAVALRDLLYGFAPLHLMAGRAPLIAAIIWAFSLSAALDFARVIRREREPHERLTARDLVAIALFLIALVGFYEPLLAKVGMARWQAGTRMTLGVPWIALVGYPSLGVPFFLLWNRALESRRPLGWRAAELTVAIPLLALGHALGLQALKSWLGW